MAGDLRYGDEVRSVFTRASAALDRSVVRFMERRMAPRTPRLDHGDARQRLIALANEYGDGTLGSPSPFFPAPEHPDPRMTPLGDGPLGTQVIDLAFSSGYQPFHPAARDSYLSITENMTAHARWWASDRGRPTIVILHGWGGGNHWVTARTFVVPYWLRHGYDVVAFQLPFHGQRAPEVGSSMMPKSGALFPTPNPLRTNEAFGHAIYDLRALALFLRGRSSTAVGVMGMSLGGYTTALWASVAGVGDPTGVDFAVAMIPAVSMARLMWRHGETSPMRRRAQQAGITEDLLADAFAVHAPTTRPARLPRERLYVIAGRGDRITFPDQAEALAAHWDTNILWFDGGHLAQLGRGDAMRSVRRALSAHGFEGRAFRS
jgi:pimeloyl-ACP methyl ester carboxylesterase